MTQATYWRGLQSKAQLIGPHTPMRGFVADEDDWSALSSAVLFHGDRMARALIAAGAPLDDANTVTRAAGMSPAVLQMLLDRNVDCTNLRTSDGATPLHIAARRGDDVCRCTTPCTPTTWRLACCYWRRAPTPTWTFCCSTGSRVLLHGLLAVGVRGPVQCVHANPEITAVRIAWRTDDELAGARRAIARTQRRALQVCLGLHARGLDALQLCEILMYACGRMAPLISFHQWCAIATTVKHFAFARSVAPVHL